VHELGVAGACWHKYMLCVNIHMINHVEMPLSLCFQVWLDKSSWEWCRS
jgi:hypothetical protein